MAVFLPTCFRSTKRKIVKKSAWKLVTLPHVRMTLSCRLRLGTSAKSVSVGSTLIWKCVR